MHKYALQYVSKEYVRKQQHQIYDSFINFVHEEDLSPHTIMGIKKFEKRWGFGSNKTVVEYDMENAIKHDVSKEYD